MLDPLARSDRHPVLDPPAGYEITGTVASAGRYGPVYAGRHVASGTAVVLKSLAALPHAVPPSAAAVADRLSAVATAIDRLRTDHVTRILDVLATRGDRVVLVTERGVGGSLAGVVQRRGRLAPPEVVTLIAPLASALAAAHAEGLAHRRVSSTNVVFDAGGRPLLTDLGVDDAITGRPFDPAAAAADVHALAALGRSVLDPAHAPAALLAALEAATVPDPRERLTAGELAAAILASTPAAPLGLTAASSPPSPSPAPTSPVAGRHRRPRSTRSRGLVLASVVALFAVAAGIAITALRAAPVDATSAVPMPPAPSVDWARIVAAISDARARAFATLRDDNLAAVYAPSSPLLARDRATLRALRTDRLHIRGHPPALAVRGTQPITATRDTVVLDVVEVAGTYQIVDTGGRVVRDNTTPAQRRLTLSLVRVGQRWLVESFDPEPHSYGGGPSR